MYVCVCLLYLGMQLLLSHFSRVRPCTTLWTAARQASLSMKFSRQEYWNGLPCPPPEDLPNPGIEPRSPASQADSLLSEPLGKPIFEASLFNYGFSASEISVFFLQFREAPCSGSIFASTTSEVLIMVLEVGMKVGYRKRKEANI